MVSRTFAVLVLLLAIALRAQAEPGRFEQLDFLDIVAVAPDGLFALGIQHPNTAGRGTGNLYLDQHDFFVWSAKTGETSPLDPDPNPFFRATYGRIRARDIRSCINTDGVVYLAYCGTVKGIPPQIWRSNDNPLIVDLPKQPNQVGVGIDSIEPGLRIDGAILIKAEDERFAQSVPFSWTPNAPPVFFENNPMYARRDPFAKPRRNLKLYTPDRSVVVGTLSYGLFKNRTFVWTEADGELILPAPYDQSGPTVMSKDGSVVAGYALLPFHPSLTDDLGHETRELRAFVWTREKGVRMISPLRMGSSYRPQVMSDDGTLVGGISFDGDFSAFIWDETHGIRTAREYLEGRGVHVPEGWRLAEITWFSPDARIIAGAGWNPDKLYCSWIAMIE